jgi:phosphomannomutase
LSYVDTEKIAAARLNAAIDPFYGAATVLMPRLARAAGLNITVIRDEPDPFFGGLLPDPSEKNLEPLRELVLKEKLDVGLALDGDADRFGVIADDGSYLTPNQVIALLLKHMVKNREAKGAVARTVATTRLIDKMAASYGVDVVETPVGFKYVGQVMRERDVIIGGEESGGLSVLGHIPEKDGLLANLLIAEMIAFEGKPLSRIWDGIRQEFGEVHNNRLDIHYPLDKKDALLSGLKEAPPKEFGGLEVLAVRTVEGVGLDLAGGAWMLVRPSGTEPLVRVYMEAGSQDALDAMKKAAEEMLAS